MNGEYPHGLPIPKLVTLLTWPLQFRRWERAQLLTKHKGSPRPGRTTHWLHDELLRENLTEITRFIGSKTVRRQMDIRNLNLAFVGFEENGASIESHQVGKRKFHTAYLNPKHVRDDLDSSKFDVAHEIGHFRNGDMEHNVLTEQAKLKWMQREFVAGRLDAAGIKRLHALAQQSQNREYAADATAIGFFDDPQEGVRCAVKSLTAIMIKEDAQLEKDGDKQVTDFAVLSHPPTPLRIERIKILGEQLKK